MNLIFNGVLTGPSVENSPWVLTARILGQDGQPIAQNSIASIAYTVTDVTTGTVIAAAQDLTVADVVFNDLQQTDPRWKWDDENNPGADGLWGYNFQAVIPGSNFVNGGDTYQVDVVFTPTSGNPFRVPFASTPTQVYG